MSLAKSAEILCSTVFVLLIVQNDLMERNSFFERLDLQPQLQ